MPKFSFRYNLCILLTFFSFATSISQHSVARLWNEAQLAAIRKDLGRPTVQARNLYHLSLAMYEAWTVFDSEAKPLLLGKTLNGFTCPFFGFSTMTNIDSARNEAISYAAYKLLHHRYKFSPNYNSITKQQFNNLFTQLGYDTLFTSTDYSTGSAAALGNYIAQCVITYGLLDGSNEINKYANTFYQPVNPPLIVVQPGNPKILDPNRWQPLTLEIFIDQNGNVIPGNTPGFLSPEWGKVFPFALDTITKKKLVRKNNNYFIYHDPGAPPYLDTTQLTTESEQYQWNFGLVASWSGHLDPKDSVKWDISPASSGNIQSYPKNLSEYPGFYNFNEGGDPGNGYTINPKTGLPYNPQIVPRGDYTRALAEFWADGPNSETPPGHWFTVINYVSDQPGIKKQFGGKGPILSNLEWDIKSYLTLGGSMHDAAITVWGLKGWYDYIRPISALRKMADLGQSSDSTLPHYHVAGIQLVPGRIEIVKIGDPLSGVNNVNVGKIKLYAWRGPSFVPNPLVDHAGTDWILAENWVPYQRPTFVTPPFAGYISGHSTFSRTAAEILTELTGDPFFPGGMSQFQIKKNEFLVFEDGPSVDLTLQWATYRDASDQCSLSRIWGGIHPPADDIPGRLIGMELAKEGFNKAKYLFYVDKDQDGYLSYEDCDDHNALIHPGILEICDGTDNDCDGMIDDSIQLFRYYLDADVDGFGNQNNYVDTCASSVIGGHAINNLDCDDSNPLANPNTKEICDGIDNDCDGMVDDSLKLYRYYRDDDGDRFGDGTVFFDSCLDTLVMGYVKNGADCNDQYYLINPNAQEICDAVDNDCDGLVDDSLQIFRYYQDTDGDFFGNVNQFIDTCALFPIFGYVENHLDCDDLSSSINPGASEICDGLDNDCDGRMDDSLNVFRYYRDQDLDGYGNLGIPLDTCSSLPFFGYVMNNIDCNDTNSLINPSAIEICDEIDNDCDGLVDDSLQINRYFLDADSDGFGDAKFSIDTCVLITFGKYVTNNGDCNDSDSKIFPNQIEICDGLDNDCDNQVDDSLVLYTFYQDKDGDGYGNANVFFEICVNTPIPGFVMDFSDCNDLDENIYPGTSEICDEIDNNCNGIIDEGFPHFIYYKDEDADGFGNLNKSIDICSSTPISGYVSDSSDCNDQNFLIYPNAPELCDGFDNDCNGYTDDSLMLFRYFRDLDRDGFGSKLTVIDTCLEFGIIGFVGNDLDCDDFNPSIHPGAKEKLDSLDNDCNGLIDDNIVATNDIISEDIYVYPNPFQNEIIITSKSLHSAIFYIYDINGNLSYKTKLKIDGSTRVDTYNISPGVYLIAIYNPAGELLSKHRMIKIN